MSEEIHSLVSTAADGFSESALDKIQDETIGVGEEVCWMFKDDREYLNKWCDEKVTKRNWRKHATFHGILVPLPGFESRRRLDCYQMVYEAFICVTHYPVEKCNPEIDWVPLATLLKCKDLLWFGSEKPNK